jgi:hypothetical protein
MPPRPPPQKPANPPPTKSDRPAAIFPLKPAVHGGLLLFSFISGARWLILWLC